MAKRVGSGLLRYARLTRRQLIAFALASAAINGVITASVGAWLALRRRLKRAGFARVYDLQGARRTRYWFHLLGPGRRPEWVGPVAAASHPAFHLKNRSNHVHEGHRLNLLGAGIEEMPPADLGWLDADVSGLGLPDRFVLLIPGSSPSQAGKRWPAAACSDSRHSSRRLALPSSNT